MVERAASVCSEDGLSGDRRCQPAYPAGDAVMDLRIVQVGSPVATYVVPADRGQHFDVAVQAPVLDDVDCDDIEAQGQRRDRMHTLVEANAGRHSLRTPP